MPIKISSEGEIIEEPQLHDLRSEAASEIISENPGFLIRYGTTIFLIVLLLIGLVAWFIRYPDIVSTTAKLTSINAPKPVITKTAGKLIQLSVKENETVAKGQVLGHMETIAEPAEVLLLSQSLDSISALLDQDNVAAINRFYGKRYGHLGELQERYQTFNQAFRTFNDYVGSGFFLNKMNMLYGDQKLLQKQNEQLLQQKSLEEQDLALAQKTFDANEILKKEKVISDLEYRTEKSKLLNKESTIPQINSSLLNNEAQKTEKQKEIFELENTIKQQKEIFRQAVNSMKTAVNEWKQNFLLIAPTEGRASFNSFLQENQQLNANQTVCYINPENSSYYAEMKVPQSNFGKVKTGQKVLMKFAAYPYAEFGSVEGKVAFISQIATDSGYLAKIDLPNGLTTNYNKHIQFREGLVSNCEIITENMRLLERLYYNLYSQMKR